MNDFRTIFEWQHFSVCTTFYKYFLFAYDATKLLSNRMVRTLFKVKWNYRKFDICCKTAHSNKKKNQSKTYHISSNVDPDAFIRSFILYPISMFTFSIFRVCFLYLCICICIGASICLYRTTKHETQTEKKSKQINKVRQRIYRIEKSCSVRPKNELQVVINFCIFLFLCAVSFSLFPSYSVLVCRALTARSRNRYVLLKDYTIEAVGIAPAVYQRIHWTKSN